MPFSSNLKLSFANSLSLEESKICCLGKGKIQYLITMLDRILFSLVVMVLAFGARGQWFESCSDLIFLPCFIHLFLCYGFCL